MPGEQGDKPNLYQNTNSEYNFFLQPRVVIDDPLMSNNNVGKSAFRFQEIKVSYFTHSYSLNAKLNTYLICFMLGNHVPRL